jgi:hydrogenase expression/formation protein HypE
MKKAEPHTWVMPMSSDGKSVSAYPTPVSECPHVLLAHGGGGQLMHHLIKEVFAPAFRNPSQEAEHDGAVLDLSGTRLAFTTDSFVVDPLFFPGGDIGSLAVFGTINDLAMCGARPLYLSASFIIEEGFPTASLWEVVRSMRLSADAAEVSIVTGDTKVVDHGKGHGLFVNTAGIGLISHDLTISPRSVQPGDVVIINGDIGRHGMAVMAKREGLTFEPTIESDCAPLAASVLELIRHGVEIHCLRDLTRGGLATALVEIAQAGHRHISVDEGLIPVTDQVRGACEILGLDPLYVANEGRLIAITPEEHAEKALSVLCSCFPALRPTIIGRVTKEEPDWVTLKTLVSAERVVEMLSGEQLPRIC